MQRGLRDLVGTDSRFLSFPMVEPEVSWFPDAWTPDEAGVHRLIRRVMTHVGLGETPLVIERYVAGADDEDRHVLAYFEGIVEGVARFGVNVAQLGDPEFLIGVLAHEVAHAYRDIHGLVVEDHDEEEELTDLTTVFFGFGVFTTNNARRETNDGASMQLRRAGYLTDHAMSFALACWVRARGIDVDVALLERWLEKDQLSAFGRYLAELPTARIRERLGVEAAPQPKERPARKLSDAPPPLADGEPIDFASKRGRVFRVAVRPLKLTAICGAVVGGSLAWMQTHAVVAAIVGAVLGVLAGVGIGRLLARDDCSECDFRIPFGRARCPRCGSMVVGTIADRNERSGALERLRLERVDARRRALTR